MDAALNLSNLHELLHSTLLITKEVIEVLKKDCDEAIFVLKPWQMKIVTTEQEDENIHNRIKTASVNEAEKIAAKINKSILLERELREKLKHNVTSQIGQLKKVENVYLSDHILVDNQRKTFKKNIVTQPIIIKRSKEDTTKSKKLTTLQNDKNSVAIRKSVTDSVDDIKQSNIITNKIQSKAPAIRIAAKSKEEKNFILKNKLNVKKTIPINKLEINSNSTAENSRNSSMSITSTAELNVSMHKITQQSIENASSSHSDINKNNRILHESNISQFIHEFNTSIDTVEALRQFNMPNEMVKVLKTYHAFLKTELINNLKETKRDKYKCSVDIFLTEFNAMNTATRDYLPQESHLINVATKSISLFSDIFNGSLDLKQLSSIKEAFTELGDASKQDNNYNTIKPIIKEPFCELSYAKGWMSNGIWNTSCLEHFKNFSKAYSIKYCNKKQLLLLCEAIQKLQHTEYLNTLIQIILHDIIPTVKSNIDSTSTEYARAYKMMFILYQGLNPEVPVLVRTDK